jgi:hypothetical protein
MLVIVWQYSRVRRYLTSLIGVLVIGSPAAWAGHIAREDPPEPIFTERAFIENDLEFDTDVDRDSDADTWEFAPSVTWIFFERLQLGAELPMGWRIPDEGSQRVALSDVDLSAKWLFCCHRRMGFAYLSTRVDVAPPTGDRSAGIGGTGELTLSLLGGYGLIVVESLADLSIQGQLAWDQELRPDSSGGAPQKSVLWNVAFSQPVRGGRFVPTFEILGTSVVDATQASDEETQLDLAVGSELRPFPDDHWGSPITLSGGWRFPVANRGDFRGTGVFSIEWAFD